MRSKLTSAALVFLFMSFAAFAQKAPAKAKPKVKRLNYYAGTLREFTAAAKDKRMPSMLFIYASAWGPEMADYENNVLNDTSIIKYADSNLVVYKFEVGDDPNKAASYMLDDLPAILIFDKNGWEIDRLQGYHTKDEVFNFIKQVEQ